MRWAYIFLVVVESNYFNCAKVYQMQCIWLLPVAEHVASNLGVKIAKRIVTHGAPNAVVFDFQSSLYRVSSSQPHFCIPTFTTVNLFSQILSASSHNAGLYLLQTLRASVQVFHVWGGALRIGKDFALDSNFHQKMLSVCTPLLASFCIDNDYISSIISVKTFIGLHVNLIIGDVRGVDL